MTDLNSLATTYAYDGSGRVSSVTDPYGQSTTLTYDGSGKLATATDPATRVTTFTHSGSKLSGVTLPDSSAWSFAYDSANRLTGVVDPRSKTVTVTLDAAGRASSVARPDGASESFAPYQKQGYDTSGTSGSPAAATLLAESKATYTDPNSGTTDHRVDWRGQGLTNQLSDAAGHVTTLDRDSNGLATVTIDRLNRASLATYDSQGNPTQWTYPDQNYEQYSYGSYSRVNSVRNARGYTTYISYDSYGNPTVVTVAQGNATTLTYTATGQVATTTDARNLVTTYQYDSYDRLTTIRFADNSSRSLAYDTQGNVSGSTDELGHTTTYSYDPVNRLTGKTDPLGRRITYAYDADGRRTGERWLTSGGGTARTVTATYDAASQVTSVSDPDATLTYTYDNKGRIATARSSGAAGQPDVTLTYGYNAADQRTSRVDNLSSTGRTTYAYDSAQRLTTISQSFGGSAGPVVALGYDAANRLTGVDRTAGSGGDIHTTYAYDSAGNVGTITHSVVGGSSLATFAYAYDAANRLTHETNAEGSVTYSYNNTNQLTSATGARSESYAYDANGNRNATGYTVGTGGTLSASPNATYTYDAAGHVTAKTDTATGKVTTFSYDYRDRLTGATRKTSGGVVDYQVTYTYDALNRRIGEQIDGDGAGSGAPVQTWTIFDGENPYADFTGSGAVAERYLYGPAVDSLLARTDASGVTDWYLADRLGSVRDIVDVSGNVVYHTGYDSFGNNISTTGTGGDRFGFTGREHDAALNLYYSRARFYDPATGRFLSRDPIGFGAGDANLFRYVGNGPTDGTDPSGEIPAAVVAIFVVGGAFFTGNNFVNAPNLGDPTYKANWEAQMAEQMDKLYAYNPKAFFTRTKVMPSASYGQVRTCMMLNDAYGRGRFRFTGKMLSNSKRIATGSKIDKIEQLLKLFGGEAEKWIKKKTWNELGKEIHWYEHVGIGRVGEKYKGEHDPF